MLKDIRYVIIKASVPHLRIPEFGCLDNTICHV